MSLPRQSLTFLLSFTVSKSRAEAKDLPSARRDDNRFEMLQNDEVAAPWEEAEHKRCGIGAGSRGDHS